MNFYPTDGEGPIEEIWDGKLVLGEHAEQLTPMVQSLTKPDLHYYVNELCEVEGGELFIPIMFLRRQGAMWARGHMVTCEIDVSALLVCVSLNNDGLRLNRD